MDLQVYPEIKEDLASRFVGGHPFVNLDGFPGDGAKKKTPLLFVNE